MAGTQPASWTDRKPRDDLSLDTQQAGLLRAATRAGKGGKSLDDFAGRDI